MSCDSHGDDVTPSSTEGPADDKQDQPNMQTYTGSQLNSQEVECLCLCIWGSGSQTSNEFE